MSEKKRMTLRGFLLGLVKVVLGLVLLGGLIFLAMIAEPVDEEELSDDEWLTERIEYNERLLAAERQRPEPEPEPTPEERYRAAYELEQSWRSGAENERRYVVCQILEDYALVAKENPEVIVDYKRLFNDIPSDKNDVDCRRIQFETLFSLPVEEVKPLLQSFFDETLKAMKEDGFDPAKRYRAKELYAKGSTVSNPFHCSSDMSSSVLWMYELSRILQKDEVLWARHYADNLMTFHGCDENEGPSGPEVAEGAGKAFEIYMTIKDEGSAKHAASVAAAALTSTFNNGEYSETSGNYYIDPWDLERIAEVKLWLERAGESKPDIESKVASMVRSAAEEAEEKLKYDEAKELYGFLGDKKNFERMKILSGKEEGEV